MLAIIRKYPETIENVDDAHKRLFIEILGISDETLI
jgi:hypothetical protein